MLRKDQKTISRQGIKMVISAIYMDLEVGARRGRGWGKRSVTRAVTWVALPLTPGAPADCPRTRLCLSVSVVTPTVHPLSLHRCDSPQTGFPASTLAPLQTTLPTAAGAVSLKHKLDHDTCSLHCLFFAPPRGCRGLAVVSRPRCGFQGCSGPWLSLWPIPLRPRFPAPPLLCSPCCSLAGFPSVPLSPSAHSRPRTSALVFPFAESYGSGPSSHVSSFQFFPDHPNRNNVLPAQNSLALIWLAHNTLK